MRQGRPVVYRFVTYPFVLESNWGVIPNPVGPLGEHLRNAFMHGLPGGATKSPSQMPELMLKYKEIKKSPLCAMALAANYRGKGDKQHDTVQAYFLARDPHTIATEAPVWGEDMEGSIDILQFDGKISILDFKPGCHKCVEAAMTQLYWYRKLLAAHLGRPTSNFDCFAFDDKRCYQLIS